MVHVKKTATAKVRSLKTAEWPVADRKAWEAACRPAIRLQRGGTAAHMKEVTRRDLAKRMELGDSVATAASAAKLAATCMQRLR